LGTINSTKLAKTMINAKSNRKPFKLKSPNRKMRRRTIFTTSSRVRMTKGVFHKRNFEWFKVQPPNLEDLQYLYKL
jgi:hypothetical protein